MAFPNSHPFMFQTNHEDHHHHHFHQGLSHSNRSLMMKRSMSFSGIENNHYDAVHGDDELSEDGSHIGEKKKRLKLEQVKALEKSFEIGNKLEPERKMQLAKALGLQQRQVAIWFQNRRARWKTKQLEKEYEVLKNHFQDLKVHNHNLKAQNQKLHGELQALKNRECFESGTISLKKETDQGSWSNGSDISSNINLDLSTKPIMNSSIYSHNGKTLLHNSSRLELQEESFTNMFHNIEDQQNFWPWPEQNHFN